MGLKDLFDPVVVAAGAAALLPADIAKFVDDVKGVMAQEGLLPVVRIVWKLKAHAGPYQTWHGKAQVPLRTPMRIVFEEDEGAPYPFPNDALQYARLDVVANPVPMAEEDEQDPNVPPAELAVPPNVWEVDTWHGAIEGLHGGKEVLKLTLQMEYGGPSLNLSPRRTQLLQALLLWIDTASEIADYRDTSLVKLGREILRALRDQITEEQHGKDVVAGIHDELLGDQRPGDKYLAALTKASAQRKTSAKKGSVRTCTFCKKKGHSEAYCWAKRDGTMPSNSKAGAGKKTAGNE
jgi:hypothetical protein